ncbi:MAG: hypothetical protein HQL11_05530, partial [Candidatus Omnitrophica bacterium]|nr:hypothetical protein [Candidatus Omnitrophota bacterium]
MSVRPQVLHETDHERYARLLLGQTMNVPLGSPAPARRPGTPPDVLRTLTRRMDARSDGVTAHLINDLARPAGTSRKYSGDEDGGMYTAGSRAASGRTRTAARWISRIGTAGIIASVASSLLGVSPWVYLAYAPYMLTGWLLIGSVIAAGNFHGRPAVQILLMALPVSVLAAMGFQRIGAEEILLVLWGSCFVFLAAFLSKTALNFDTAWAMSDKDALKASLRWLLMAGLLGRYHIYVVFNTFIAGAGIPGPFWKAVFTMGAASLLANVPVFWSLGAVFGERQNIYRDLRSGHYERVTQSKSFRSLLKLYPYNFVYWFPLVYLAFAVTPGRFGFMFLHSGFAFVWYVFIEKWVRNMLDADQQPPEGPAASEKAVPMAEVSVAPAEEISRPGGSRASDPENGRDPGDSGIFWRRALTERYLWNKIVHYGRKGDASYYLASLARVFTNMLREDFAFTDDQLEQIRRMRRDFDRWQPQEFLGNFDAAMRDLGFFEKTLFPDPFKEVDLKGYSVILGAMFKRRTLSPGAEPYIARFFDALRPRAKEEPVINFTARERTYHAQTRAATQFPEMECAYRTEDSIYFKQIRPNESRNIPDSPDPTPRRLIRLALEKAERALDRIPPETLSEHLKRFRAAFPELARTCTVLLLDFPEPVLMLDS